MARQFVLQIVYTHGLIQSATAAPIAVSDLPTGIPNANLANDSVTIVAGTGLTGGGTVTLGGSITLNATGGAGTVTSVALAAPSEFSVSGSPVTASGTLTFAWANPVSVDHGGTGLTALTSHALLVGQGSSLGFVLPGATGEVLTGNGVGADPSFQSLSSLLTALGGVTGYF